MESAMGGSSAAGGGEWTRHDLAWVHHVVTETLRRAPASVTREELTAAALAALTEANRAHEPAVHGEARRYAEQRIRAAMVDLLRSIDWQARARWSAPAPDRGGVEAAREALATLPDQQRAVIEGYFLGRRALPELAADLQVDEQEVVRLRTEALQALRQTLAPALASVGQAYRAAREQPQDRLGAVPTFAAALHTG